MPGTLHWKARQKVAELLKDSSDENFLYFGRCQPWANDAAPPIPNTNVENSSYNEWLNMLGAKKIQDNDITFIVPRHDWLTGTVYSEYDSSNEDPFNTTTPFFVITDAFNVYKCISNNNGSQSTVKPTGTSTSNVTTADGYIWKFMYNVGTAENEKFTTTNYIAVKTLTMDDGSAQWTVQTAAANGSIETIRIQDAGNNYIFNTANVVSVVNTTALVIDSNASGIDNIYNGSSIYIKSGTGAGQLKEIVDYVGLSKTVVVNSEFSVPPNANSIYYLGPKVSISGDGSGATAYANVTTTGTINQVNVVSPGLHYGVANVSISANSGAGAIARANISPHGGHGADAVKELGGHNLMFSVSLSESESNTLFTNNDFRTVGVISNPLLANGDIANSVNVYTQTLKLTVTGLTGVLTNDEFVTGGTTGATGNFVNFANTNAAGSEGIIDVTNVSGNFSTTEVITGGTSAQTATVTTITQPDLLKYSGDILYTEYREPVERANNQTENIKFIVRF